MTRAKNLLRKYQQERFPIRPLIKNFQGFDLRAYPETAMKEDLDKIGAVIKVFRNNEGCEPYRKRILLALETSDEEEAA